MAEKSVEKLKFNVMTINMKGADKKCRKETKDFIMLSYQDVFPSKPDIIFAQELPPVEWETEIKVEGYSHSPYGVTNEEAGIMWRTNTFELCPIIDEPFKWERQYWKVLPDILCRKYIPHRLCAVVLEHKTEGYKVLAVSWHGPENSLKNNAQDTDEEKQEKERLGNWVDRKRHVFKNMQRYIKVMYGSLVRTDPELQFIVIGADFNLDFNDKDTSNYLDYGFGFEKYELSTKRKGKKLIDNFLVYPIDKMEVKQPWPFETPYRILEKTPLNSEQIENGGEENILIKPSCQLTINQNGSKYIWHFLDISKDEQDYQIDSWLWKSHQYVNAQAQKQNEILVVKSSESTESCEVKESSNKKEKYVQLTKDDKDTEIQIRGHWPLVQVKSNVYIQMKSSPGQSQTLIYRLPDGGWYKDEVNEPTEGKAHVVNYKEKAATSQSNDHTSVVIIANDNTDNYLMTLKDQKIYKSKSGLQYLDHKPVLATIQKKGIQSGTDNLTLSFYFLLKY